MAENPFVALVVPDGASPGRLPDLASTTGVALQHGFLAASEAFTRVGLLVKLLEFMSTLRQQQSTLLTSCIPK